MMSKYARKIKLEDSQHLTSWNHRGGWGTVLEHLKTISTPNGVLCVSALEEVAILGETINEPWVGFVHHVPQNNMPNYHDLERLLVEDCIVKSFHHCQGLFAISHIVQQYLQKRVDVPVAKLYYPLTPFPQKKMFSWSTFKKMKRVVNIGTFMRNFQAIYDLQVPADFQKILLKPPDVDFEKLHDINKKKVILNVNDSVQLIDRRLSNEEYDDCLKSSIVFLNLYDATISTTVIECIGRNTPLLVNRLPGIEEYLGKEYPLFYDTLKEASDILSNGERLSKASKYLESLPIKSQLTGDNFLSSFTNTAIYQSLPLPQQDDQQQFFHWYNVTVVICSYKRVYNLQCLLDSFKRQDYTGTFEIILWNNNCDTQKEVAAIAKPFMQDLDIRLIQSSENYYCIVRLAIAHLMRSKHMLVCDDDIVPQPNFISTFVAKHQEYGPRAVLCCRGHVFAEHTLDEEQPYKFWENPDDDYHKKFFNEFETDRKIHFLHASTSFYPRQVLLEASSYDLPCPDTILVDDYWLSFVMSHYLKVSLWKIQGDKIFHHTPCADDKNISLYRQPRVEEERTKFYIYHMRQGWPASSLLPL